MYGELACESSVEPRIE
jgi:hypothetical protein